MANSFREIESDNQICSGKSGGINKVFENTDVLVTISEFLADHELLSFLLIKKSVAKIRKQSKVMEIRLLKYNLKNAQKILEEFGHKIENENLSKKQQKKTDYNPSITYPGICYPWAHSFYLKVNLSFEKLLLQPLQIAKTEEEPTLTDEEANQIYNFYLDNLKRKSINQKLQTSLKAIHNNFQTKNIPQEKKKENEAIFSFLKTGNIPIKETLQKDNKKENDTTLSFLKTGNLLVEKIVLQEDNKEETKGKNQIKELLSNRKSPTFTNFDDISEPADFEQKIFKPPSKETFFGKGVNLLNNIFRPKYETKHL